MATWNDIRQEINRYAVAGDQHAHDKVRRKYLQELAARTGRPVIVYAVDFMNQTDKVRAVGSDIQIALSDKEAFIEVMEAVPAGPVDLLLHSPGGSPTAAEAIVSLLRSKFDDVRVFVPNVAKSAATMIVLSANQVAMDERGEVGPIDPQFILTRDQQQVVSPAQAIKDQFRKAQRGDREQSRASGQLGSDIAPVRAVPLGRSGQCNRTVKGPRPKMAGKVHVCWAG